jgi:hypothetical protein
MTQVDFYGFEGCELVNLTDILAPLQYCTGFVQVIFGLFLLAFGAKLINYAIILLFLFTTSFGGFLILYNLGAVPGLDEGKTTVMMVVAVGCFFLGSLATYFFNRILTKNEDPSLARAKLLSSCMGGFLVGLLLAATPLSAIIKMLGIVVGAVSGYYLMKASWTDFVTCYGSSFIGSVIFFHGVGSFVGGFPNMAIQDIEDVPLDPVFFGYIVGIIFFTVSGGIYQKNKSTEVSENYNAMDKYNKSGNSEDRMFKRVE